MQTPQLLFELSPWFIILCLALGFGYAAILYSRPGPWSKVTNKLLFGVRFISASLLSFLLLGPFLKQLFNSVEDPTIVFALDNSSSVIQTSDTTGYYDQLAQLESIANNLEENGYEVVLKTTALEELNGVTELTNNGKSTDLNGIFKTLRSDYEGKNLSGVVLVSDGIYNEGLAPNYSSYNFPIYTVGLGDTIAREDITLRNIYYNKIAYQGNRFPLVAELINSGFVNREVIIKVVKDGNEVDRRTVRFTANNQLQRVDFVIDAETNGIQHYRIEVTPLSGEAVTINNRKDAYIDVIEGKEKILLVGLAPHPDIKAIASTIENNENYLLETHIPGVNELKEDKYDLVIFHQAFDRYNRNNRLIKRFIDSDTPLWLIAGNQSNINSFNQLNGLMRITVSRNQRDLVRPAHNRSFNRFKIDSEDYQSTMTDYPPVIVPFGRTELTQGGEILLYQQVGSIVTEKPLLAVHESNGKKIAVMVGEGFWQWRTMEYARNADFETFDEIVSKLIQFLSAKEDKRKFRVYPLENEFYDTEEIIFSTEVYNDIYERIYGHEVELNIIGEGGETNQFSYVTSPVNSQFKINGLNQGVYQYQASSLVNGRTERVSGEFSVSELQIESINLTADHELLKKLADDSEGEFFLANEINQLGELLQSREPQGLIYTSESFLPIINLKWPFFLLIALLSIEWFTRKYSGGY